LSRNVLGFTAGSHEITEFIKSRQCSGGGKHAYCGKHAYYRVLRAFYNWLYSPRSGYNLNSQDNPILAVDPPKVEKKILPSLTIEQIEYLIDQLECSRDKAIISLFCDTGLRISELAAIKANDIDWDNRLIRVWCKGKKEGLAVFGLKTELIIKQWLSEYSPNGGSIWGINKWGIEDMLKRLKAETGLPCNAHTFRRTFASILAKRGVDSLHIMRLGRWESIQMVERYTRSVRFEDSLKLYSPIVD
jgi:site-specific recombinase XerD